ncbi:Glycosyltransferase AglI [uncultured archaeon]|nr:Glycosyltransferase AglI [uncultured archaeon]
MQIITIIYTIMFFFGIYFLLVFLMLYFRNKSALYFYPEPKKFPSVTFLVPAYNEESSIGNTLKALLEIDYPKDKKEIIVINDGSHDRTAEITREFMKKHKEIKLLDKKNSGKADSLNQGIKIAKGELIAVSDADSYPEKDSLKKMVGFFEQEDDVAAVTSRVLVKNKTNFLEKFQAFDYAVIAWGRKILDFIDSVYVTNGPLSIYRKNVLNEVGGFDPKNLTEDIEVTWHILSRGYKTRMSYPAIVYTSVPSKLKQWVNQRVRWNLGGLQTLNKYKSFCFKGKNAFGYFVISYVGLAFFLALVGFILMFRFIFLKTYFYLWTMPFLLKGYNPLEFLGFNFLVTILFILSSLFLLLSFVYYFLILKDTNLRAKGILTVIIYNFIYRPLYLIPLILAMYRLKKGNLGWYTK